MTMIEESAGSPLARAVEQFRMRLADVGYHLGAVFVVRYEDNNLGLLFNTDMPVELKLQMFTDMRLVLDESEKRFRN
jgi:hypothetical protein